MCFAILRRHPPTPHVSPQGTHPAPLGMDDRSHGNCSLRSRQPLASSWAKQTKWHPLKRLPKLAFDHKQILEHAIDDMRNLVSSEPVWASVLPEKFTLSQLQLFYETMLNTKLDKGNFRKKVKEMPYVVPLNETQSNVSHRPSTLFRFDASKLVSTRS